jgi:hypothetical protein
MIPALPPVDLFQSTGGNLRDTGLSETALAPDNAADKTGYKFWLSGP